jgi:hypothetical protein
MRTQRLLKRCFLRERQACVAEFAKPAKFGCRLFTHVPSLVLRVLSVFFFFGSFFFFCVLIDFLIASVIAHLFTNMYWTQDWRGFRPFADLIASLIADLFVAAIGCGFCGFGEGKTNNRVDRRLLASRGSHQLYGSVSFASI